MLTPPFSMKEKFLQKAISEIGRDNANCVYVITPDSTDTKSWFHKYIANHADYIWFSRGRISYIDPDTGEQANQPTFGTCISIFGNPPTYKLERLSKHGLLLENFDPLHE